MHDLLIHQYNRPDFQRAFKTYYAELGCRVTNWDGLFAGMTENGDLAWLRLDDAGEAAAFILFKPIDLRSCFFEAKGGFIEEFWVRPENRRRG